MALYLKYRPQDFSSVIGEEHIVKMQEARNATRRPLTPEERAKISEKLKGRKKTPEELARRKATIEAKKRAAIEAALCADADN